MMMIDLDYCDVMNYWMMDMMMMMMMMMMTGVTGHQIETVT